MNDGRVSPAKDRRNEGLCDESNLGVRAEMIALEAVFIRVLANLASANDNALRLAVESSFDEAADCLEQRAMGCGRSAEQLEVHALRIVEELRLATLGKQKLRSAV